MRHPIWNGRPWQAFKTFAILFSFAFNLITLIILLAAAPLLLPTLNQVAAPIVSGLNESFVEMGQATIVRTIQVEDEMPINFTLPLAAQTVVTTTADVPLQVPAQFILPGGGGSIRGTVTLNLPAGTALPVALNLDVPVDQTIPVSLAVDVAIPIRETELSTPFNRLQGLFDPLDRLLRSLPADNQDLIDRVLGQQPAPTAVENEADVAP